MLSHRSRFPRSAVLFVAFVTSCLAVLAGDDPRPFVSPVFGEHMVIQRNKPNRIWGWSSPGAGVTVTIAERSVQTTVGDDGRWEATFQPPPQGGPYVLKIDGPQSVRFDDVLVGDVWLCSGQSNMAFGLSGVVSAETELPKADVPGIRLFRVEQNVAYSAVDVPKASWRLCEPASFSRQAGGFSAVAYFFGRRVHEETGVPIGLIQSAVGGSPVESWMSAESLQRQGDFDAALAEIERLRGKGGPQYGNYIMHWYDEHDAGIAGTAWSALDLDESGWTDVTLKDGFAALGVPDTPAVAWFRRTIELPDPLPPGQARIRLGVVEKMDTVTINERWVGASSWVENPRNYGIPGDVLRPGANQVTIRVLKVRPDGGFRSATDELTLTLGDGTVVPLEGGWKAHLGVDARPPFPLPLGYENYPTMPLVLYRGMIEPLAPLALTGALWYQGEANFTRAWQYRSLLPAMIADWRRLFGQGDFPVFIVGLPAFMQRRDTPGDDGWAELREAQDFTARTTPNTELEVIIDTGDADDIHPKDKRPVGERLALLALRDTYGRDLVASGPRYRSAERTGPAIRVRFSHTDGGLAVRGERLAGFSIAGADRQWHWADARLEGDTVVVSAAGVPEPVAVRYAWQANPEATLFNGAGLPAGPFRTDDWPVSTQSVSP